MYFIIDDEEVLENYDTYEESVENLYCTDCYIVKVVATSRIAVEEVNEQAEES